MSSVRRTTAAVQVVTVRPDHQILRPDRLATEEPMEIRAVGPGQIQDSVAVTMRTPGHDFELAVGFLLTEGLVAAPVDIAGVRYCELEPGLEQQFNIVTVRLTVPFDRGSFERNFSATSSCGICGKSTLDQVDLACATVADGRPLSRDIIPRLPTSLRTGQALFELTGGLHAAGLFDFTGRSVCIREDVGRHNAVDKVVGYAALERMLPLADHVLMVSGRVSFEIVQKAAMAGIPVVCAVSAPSSLAVDAARRLGLAIIGFVRDGSFNIYSHPERIDLG